MYMVSQVSIAEGIADGTDCQGWSDGTNNRVTSSRIHIMNIIAIYYWVLNLNYGHGGMGGNQPHFETNVSVIMYPLKSFYTLIMKLGSDLGYQGALKLRTGRNTKCKF